MKARPSRPRTRPLYESKQFWLFSVLQALGIVVVSYLVAVFTFLVLIRISELPRGPLWDDSFRSPLAFVLVVFAAGVILIPYFQREWDRGLRMFSIFSALFLLAFASLSKRGLADPNVPLRLIDTYAIEPLRALLHF